MLSRKPYMQRRVVYSQVRLNVIPIWGHDCAVVVFKERIWAGQQNYQQLRICGLAKVDEGLEGKWVWMWDCTTWSVSRSQWSGWLALLENRVQMFYLTKEPKYTLNMVYGWHSCFFSRKANLMGKTVMMSLITGNTSNVSGFEVWWKPRSKCQLKKKALYSKSAQLLLPYLAT